MQWLNDENHYQAPTSTTTIWSRGMGNCSSQDYSRMQNTQPKPHTYHVWPLRLILLSTNHRKLHIFIVIRMMMACIKNTTSSNNNNNGKTLETLHHSLCLPIDTWQLQSIYDSQRSKCVHLQWRHRRITRGRRTCIVRLFLIRPNIRP